MLSSSESCSCGLLDDNNNNNNINKSNESIYEMLSMLDALDIVLNQAKILFQQKYIDYYSNNVMQLCLDKCLNYVTASPIYAINNIPSFRASTVDGFAANINYNNNNTNNNNTYKLINMAHTAGNESPSSFNLSVDNCVYITTGACLPNGANTVQMVEFTKTIHDNNILFTEIPKLNANIRDIGSDIATGELLVESNKLITPVELGLLASNGICDISVYRNLTIGVLSSGNELCEYNNNNILSSAQIRDSNRIMLINSIIQFNNNINVIDLGIINDDTTKLHDKILSSLDNCDIIITSGGVSMGSLDLIKPLLNKIGQIHFGRLNMKPGKPTTFATINHNNYNKLIFALPGNPVSAAVTFQLLVLPAIKLLLFGSNNIDSSNAYEVLNVTLLNELILDSRPEYHRIIVNYDTQLNDYIAISTGKQQSSRLLSNVQSNALLVLPSIKQNDNNKIIKAGTKLQAIVTAKINPLTKTQLTSAKQHISIHNHNHHTHTIQTNKVNNTDFTINISVLTISDRVSQGLQLDKSGPTIVNLLKNARWPKSINCNILNTHCVSDDINNIQNIIKLWTDNSNDKKDNNITPDIIITTGGTGFSVRDNTPEAIIPLIHKECSGLNYAIMHYSMLATPNAALSRSCAGIRNCTLILALPGSPKAGPEILTPLINILPHAIKLMKSQPDSHQININHNSNANSNV